MAGCNPLICRQLRRLREFLVGAVRLVRKVHLSGMSGEDRVKKAAGDKGTNDGLKENERRREDRGAGRRDGGLHFGTPVVDGGDRDGSGGLAQWIVGARREAQLFLFEDNEDFQAVCGSAGLDPATLRARLLKIGKRVHMQGPYLQSMAA